MRKRKCDITRQTRETRIVLVLDLDGKGRYDIKVEDAFFRHMVETMARYAGFDLSIEAKGDIDHHLIEDVAICMGRALRSALDERPVERIGSATVPMDDALVSVHIDIVDRPYVHIELPHDDLYEHFLRSFAMEAKLTLHTRIERGKDRHHIIEATFKALGKSLYVATRQVDRLVSTKEKVVFGRKRKGGPRKKR